MSHAHDLTGCPYFGLQPATERDAQYFFGREREQRIIKNNLYSRRTVLYGASGVGKSSLLLAGVTPQLRQPGLAVVVFRQYQDDDIAGSLKRAVLEAVRECARSAPDVDLSLPLDAFFFECNRVATNGIILIFDQFESYFLHHPPSPAASAFESEFAKAVNRPDIDVRLLLALREDRLSNLDRFQGRVEIFQNLLRVEPMKREEAAVAIRRPLEKYNESQPPGHAFSIEDPLVEALLDDVTMLHVATGTNGAQAGEQVDTPSLQLALLALWHEEKSANSRLLRLTTYERLGRAERIVGSHLERIMSAFDKRDRQLAARLFRYLVTPAGIKIAHTAEDLATYTGEPTEKVESVLERLCEPSARVLQKVAPLPGQRDATRYEIFHDVLAPAILEWQADYRVEEARRRADEQRAVERARRLRWTVAAMAVGLFALSGLTIFAFRQRGEAQRQSQRAERQSQRAERRREEAEESEKRARKAEEDLKVSLNSESQAKEDAKKQAAAADEARRLAEQEKNRADDERDKAVKAQEAERQATLAAQEAARVAKQAEQAAEAERQAAVAAEKAAVVARKAAELALKTAEDRRIQAEVAQEDAQKRGEEAKNSRRETVKYIEQVKKIDSLTPFAEGVIRNPEPQPLVNAVYTPDASSIVTTNMSGHVLFWKTGEVTNPPEGALPKKSAEFRPDAPALQGTDLKVIALSSDGRRAATADSGMIYIWEPPLEAQPAGGQLGPPATLEPIPQKVLHTLSLPAGQKSGGISSLAVTKAGSPGLVAAGTENGYVVVWNLKQCGEVPHGCVPIHWRPHKARVNSITFSPDGRFLATGSGMETPRRAGNAARNKEQEQKVEDIRCDEFESADNSAMVWESWPSTGVGKPHLIKELKGHRCRVTSVAFNDPELASRYNPKQNGKKILRLVTAGDDGTAKAWNILRLSGPKGGFAKGWKEVDTDVYTLNVYEAPRVRTWLFRQPLRKFFSYSLGLRNIKRIQVPMYAAAFSPINDNLIVTAGEEGALRIWDVPSSSTVRIIQGQYGIRNVAFSLGGKYVVSVGGDQTVRLWTICEKGGASHALGSVIANLTTSDALNNLEAYCARVGNEQLPRAVTDR